MFGSNFPKYVSKEWRVSRPGGFFSRWFSQIINNLMCVNNRINVSSSGLISSEIVGGGGGAATAGGGGGQVLVTSNESISVGTYAVVIGPGGAGQAYNNGLNGGTGTSSTFNSHTAVGGGGGGQVFAVGSNGACGGGGGQDNSVSRNGGTGSPGFNGGKNNVSGQFPAGGGGGMGAVGADAPSGTTAGNGGNGVASSVPGNSSTLYGAGGGGGVNNGSGTGGTGGTSGGGNGSNGTGNGTAGTPNTGSGGGGCAGGASPGSGGSGGSGIVAIWYLSGTINATGGTITNSGGYTIHTFTSNANFVVNSLPTTNQESSVVRSQDSSVSGEYGQHTFGDDNGRTILAGSVIGSKNSPFGYLTGSGGIISQSTNKSTGVILNKVCGQITMNNAALAAATIVSFTLTNSYIAANDTLILNHISGGTPGSYGLNARCAAGSATIDVRNNSAGSLSEAVVIQFSLIKAVTS